MKKHKLTEKGKAYYLACKHGLCPKTEDGYDTTNFDKFWEEYTPYNYEILADTIKTYRASSSVAIFAAIANACMALANFVMLVLRVI